MGNKWRLVRKNLIFTCFFVVNDNRRFVITWPGCAHSCPDLYCILACWLWLARGGGINGKNKGLPGIGKSCFFPMSRMWDQKNIYHSP